jgi:hypothetical protein
MSAPKDPIKEAMALTGKGSVLVAPKGSLADAMLAGHADAFGLFADLMRARGMTYGHTYAAVCAVFRNAGRMAPTLAEFDALLAEADG